MGIEGDTIINRAGYLVGIGKFDGKVLMNLPAGGNVFVFGIGSDRIIFVYFKFIADFAG